MTKREIEKARKVSVDDWELVRDILFSSKRNYEFKKIACLHLEDKQLADAYAQQACAIGILIDYIDDICEEIGEDDKE